MVWCKGLFHSAVIFHRENSLKSKRKEVGWLVVVPWSDCLLLWYKWRSYLSMCSVFTVAILVVLPCEQLVGFSYERKFLSRLA